MAKWRDRRLKILCAVLLGLAVTGFALFGVTWSKLSAIEGNLQQMVQGHLDQVLSAYGGIDLRSANVTGEILPDMQEHFYRAQALDDALVSLFGGGSELLPDRIHQDFLAVMSEYQRCARTGQSDDGARNMLDACMADLNSSITLQFDARGNLTEIEH